MRIQDHIGKITWTVLDKGLFITYGMIRMLQVSRMQPSEFGLFALLDALVLTIGTLSDNFSIYKITIPPTIRAIATEIGLNKTAFI